MSVLVDKLSANCEFVCTPTSVKVLHIGTGETAEVPVIAGNIQNARQRAVLLLADKLGRTGKRKDQKEQLDGEVPKKKQRKRKSK